MHFRIVIDDKLHKAAKVRAAEDEITLHQLIVEGIKLYLKTPKKDAKK
jgi:predicted HicB family RNase H-like nuclease